MSAEPNENAHVNEIHKEYTRIDKDWLAPMRTPPRISGNAAQK